MIALISGTVAVRRADHVVIDCGGVGYQLAVSAQTLRPPATMGGAPVVVGTNEPDVFVDQSVLDSLGPTPTLPQLLRGPNSKQKAITLHPLGRPQPASAGTAPAASIDRGRANAAATAVHHRDKALRLRPGSMCWFLLAGLRLGKKSRLEPVGALP